VSRRKGKFIDPVWMLERMCLPSPVNGFDGDGVSPWDVGMHLGICTEALAFVGYVAGHLHICVEGEVLTVLYWGYPHEFGVEEFPPDITWPFNCKQLPLPSSAR
jgi:hypothetical protein